MTRFRKRPVEIDAIQWKGDNWAELLPFVAGHAHVRNRELVIPTLEGEMIANVGDWIIRGVAGEFYPCKPEIFEATYEAVWV